LTFLRRQWGSFAIQGDWTKTSNHLGFNITNLLEPTRSDLKQKWDEMKAIVDVDKKKWKNHSVILDFSSTCQKLCNHAKVGQERTKRKDDRRIEENDNWKPCASKNNKSFNVA